MSDKPAPQAGERLAKVIARAGVCSRRDAETWITAGRVAVNGSVVKTPAFNVVEADTIAVDGKAIARKQATQLWLYHKPAGLMVTEKDPEGRPTVFEALTRLGLPRVLTVGRLDYNTEGLLLVTNDGGLKRTLELPSTGWVRRYRVRAFGSVTQEQLNGLKDGITVDGVEYGPIEAELDTVTGSNVWITMALREGKNREVRNVLGGLGLEVNRLIRISYGPFQLGDLPGGHVEKVKTRILKDQLGKRLAGEAGVDFDSPEPDETGQPRRRAPEKTTTERDRFTGLRRRPDFRRDERAEPAPRTVHFDDGRSESFVPNSRPKRDEDGPRGGKRGFGDRPQRRDGDRPFDKGPRKSFDGERPARREDGKSFGNGPRRPGGGSGDRPFRKEGGFRPRGEREDRGNFGDRGPRREGGFRPRGEGEERRSFGDRPPRRDGDRPFNKGPRRDGPRPEGAGSDRPFRKEGGFRPRGEGGERGNFGDRGPRREGGFRPRGEGEERRSFGDRPPRRDGDRPFNKGPRRDGPRPEGAGSDRPFRKEGGFRPRGEGEERRSFGDRPPRRKDEDRPLARRTAPGKDAKFEGRSGAPRRDGGKPFTPRGPRKDGGRPGGGKPFNKGPRRPRDE